MINLKPTVCNICGGEVRFIRNSEIYNGRSFGSGYCYCCMKCGAYVGTHKSRPHEAMGILADKEMREMKMKCHDIFDAKWKKSKRRHYSRDLAYQRLANKMGIPVEECHFGYFNMEQLQQAYEILTTSKKKNLPSN